MIQPDVWLECLLFLISCLPDRSNLILPCFLKSSHVVKIQSDYQSNLNEVLTYCTIYDAIEECFEAKFPNHMWRPLLLTAGIRVEPFKPHPLTTADLLHCSFERNGSEMFIVCSCKSERDILLSELRTRFGDSQDKSVVLLRTAEGIERLKRPGLWLPSIKLRASPLDVCYSSSQDLTSSTSGNYQGQKCSTLLKQPGTEASVLEAATEGKMIESIAEGSTLSIENVFHSACLSETLQHLKFMKEVICYFPSTRYFLTLCNGKSDDSSEVLVKKVEVS